MSNQGHQLTEEDARESLRNHILVKTAEARTKYGIPDGAAVGLEQIRAMLEDSEVVRYKTRVSFDAGALEAGEFAFAEPAGEHPSDGFTLHIHPALERCPDDLPLAIAYHIVTINYGEIAGSTEAELFGANLLGLDVDDYYQRLCAIADSLPPTVQP